MTYLTDNATHWRMTENDGFAVYSKTHFPTVQSVAAYLNQDVIYIKRERLNAEPMHEGYCHKACGCSAYVTFLLMSPDGSSRQSKEGYKSIVSAHRAAIINCTHPLNKRYWHTSKGAIGCHACKAVFTER